MASSETDIINIGLIGLGEATLMTINDDGDVATAARTLWATNRDFELASHPWNGLAQRASLALLNGTPLFDYTYQFALPSNCLRVFRTDDDGAQWSIETATDLATKVLLYNVSEVEILYMPRVTNVALYSPGLQLTLAALMSWKLALALTAHRGKAQDKAQEYIAQRSLALAMDGQEGSPAIIQVTTLTNDVR